MTSWSHTGRFCKGGNFQMSKLGKRKIGNIFIFSSKTTWFLYISYKGDTSPTWRAKKNDLLELSPGFPDENLEFYHLHGIANIFFCPVTDFEFSYIKSFVLNRRNFWYITRVDTFCIEREINEFVRPFFPAISREDLKTADFVSLKINKQIILNCGILHQNCLLEVSL